MKNDTKKCLCDDPQCAKCLMVNCEDDNCATHTLEAKSMRRGISLTYVQSDKSDEEKVNRAFEILFEEVSKMDDEEAK